MFSKTATRRFAATALRLRHTRRDGQLADQRRQLDLLQQRLRGAGVVELGEVVLDLRDEAL